MTVPAPKRKVRILLKVLEVLCGAGFLVFIFTPTHTPYQVAICIGSLLVGLSCAIAAGHLDDRKTGFWPTPLEWENREMMMPDEKQENTQRNG